MLSIFDLRLCELGCAIGSVWSARTQLCHIACPRYDAIHNRHLVGADETNCIRELYNVAKELAGAVIPSEYGTDPKSKLTIGSKICGEVRASGTLGGG